MKANGGLQVSGCHASKIESAKTPEAVAYSGDPGLIDAGESVSCFESCQQAPGEKQTVFHHGDHQFAVVTQWIATNALAINI